ncbi:19816_t:CDS:10 [Funneliformis geosporum]|nr:19816_t:CDS:10 [Funneliformis geosporum]
MSNEKVEENISEQNNDEYLSHHDTNLYPKLHVAISPNGQQVATFNTVNSLSEIRPIKCDALNDIDSSSRLVWSLAISNPIDQIDNGDMHAETLIALSCFDEKDMMLGKSISSTTASLTYQHQDGEKEIHNLSYEVNDEEKARELIKSMNANSWVISTWREARISTEVDEFGGLIRFLDDDPLHPHTATILVVNVNGITKTSFNLDNITIKKTSTCDDYSSWWEKLPIFPQPAPRQELIFPLKVQAELIKLYQNTPCLELLSRSIENDYFIIEDYKDRMQVVEMYNMRTNQLEMVFHQRAESVATSFGHGSPAVAISRHKTFLAYCRGANSITIYLMENSLEISTQCFPHIERILLLDFINEDESLLIIAQEKENSPPLIIIWDLFSYMDNAIRVLRDTKKLFPFQQYRLVRNCGTILLIDNSDGSVIPILNDPFIKNILVPAFISKRKLIELRLQYLHDSEWDQAVYHTVFNQKGEYYDAESEKEKNSVIVNDMEPWVHNKDYGRISAFLDDEKTTQLFIGETSVQVWYRKDKNSKKRLKYIWVIPTKGILIIKSLEIGKREFKVTLSSQPTQSFGENNEVIHWPFKINAVGDACSALRYLYKKRDDPAGPKKQQQYENLVQTIETSIRKFILKRPAIWRLIDVRYNVMASLIYGRRVHLVQQILNTKDSDFSMRYLHTPRLYEWPRKPKTSDLEIVIKCCEGRRQKRDVEMIGFFLDYYSDNAMDNTGWMFTVSRAIPLLFENRLDTYLKDLFSKPIFGTKEIHLDESHINAKDLPQGKIKFIKAFIPKTELMPKTEPSRIRNIKELQPIMKIIDKSKNSFTHNQQLAALQKVIPGLDRGDSSALVALRLVPLPDFTVFPDGTKDKDINYRMLPLQLLRMMVWPRGYTITKSAKLSPFLRVIRKDKNGMVFDNPAMEAVIDFKWESARNHFLRHAFLFFCFAGLFCVLTGAVRNSFVKKTLVSAKNADDDVAIIMPLATYSVELIRESRGDVPKNQLKQLTIAIAFTVLVLWMELFLLLRYFSGTGNFIYIIINIMRNVWPFIAFMGIVVFAHGHAMYLLLRNPDGIDVTPNGSSFNVMDQNGVYQNFTIEQSFNLSNPTDNYFSNFGQSVAAVYFWINGRWDQLEQWDFWPVGLLSFIASVLLVIVMQNMLIAFMSGVFDEAKSDGRLAVLKYRAELIADYETLEKPFGDSKGNPRHIFYISNTNKISKWLRNSSGEWDITGLDVDSYERKNIERLNRSSGIEFYSSWTSVSDHKGLISGKISSGSTERRNIQDKKMIFKDNVRRSSSIDDGLPAVTNSRANEVSSINDDVNTIHGEILTLKDSVKSVEGSIDNRLNLLEGKLVEMMDLLNKLATANNLNSSGDASSGTGNI